jgi:hypothetical protein
MTKGANRFAPGSRSVQDNADQTIAERPPEPRYHILKEPFVSHVHLLEASPCAAAAEPAAAEPAGPATAAKPAAVAPPASCDEKEDQQGRVPPGQVAEDEDCQGDQDELNRPG